MDCGGCQGRSSSNCSQCATAILRDAGCQFDGTPIASPTQRETNKSRLLHNNQRRFENSFLSLSCVPETIKVFKPGV